MVPQKNDLKKEKKEITHIVKNKINTPNVKNLKTTFEGL